MEKRLPSKIMSLLKKIGRVAAEAGTEAYVVGGFVRDLFLDEKNYDVDLVVEGDPEEFGRVLSKALGGKLIFHRRFGTGTVFLPGSSSGAEEFKIGHVDFVGARREYYTHPAALPRVELSSLRDDLYRRDFTINTMAVKLNRIGFGELIDFFGGRKDLKAGEIRILHERSFVDDPTRIFRAVRLEQRLGFRIENRTEELIRAAVKRNLFQRVGYARIREEIIPILSEQKPEKAIARMNSLHELHFIHRRLRFSKRVHKLILAVESVLNWFEKSFPQRGLSRWIVYFCALTDSLSREEVEQICRRFAFSRRDKKIILEGKRKAPEALRVINRRGKVSSARVYQLLKPLAGEAILYLLARARRPGGRDRIISFLTHGGKIRLEINGNDLRALGISPGPNFKRILNQVLEARIEGKVRTKKEQLELARKIASRLG